MPEEKELRALPAPAGNGNGNGNGHVPAVPDPITVYPPYAYTQPETEEPVVPLAHYLWILKRHKWRIIAFVLVSVVCTVIVSSRLTPVYESTATIDVDRQAPSSVVGQDVGSRVDLYDSDQFLATQIKIIQSDSVLRPVAQRFKFDVTEADTRAGKPAMPSARAANAPVSLGGLKVARPPNTYLLLISYRSTNPELASDVANAVAASYIQHTYDIRFRATAGLSAYMEKQIEELRAKMEKSSAALAQFEKDLSVINPEEKTSILSSRLLQLNTEYTTAQGDRVRQQAAYNSVKSGSMEAAQASTQGEQLRRLADHLDEAREKFATVAAQYGAGHPEYKKAHSQVAELERQLEALKSSIESRVDLDYRQAANRESMLASAVAETKAEFDKLNAHSFEYKALKQEADSDKGLYEELVRKIKEAGINSSFQNSSIRLADSARPGADPVFPNVRMNAMLAFLFSTLLAVGLSVLADLLDNTVRDPEDIQRTLKTEVLGSLPVVKHWRSRLLRVRMTANGTNVLVKYGGHNSQEAAFEEAIRTLRDSILLSDLGRRPRTLLITSATPREGKTTAAIRLAIVHSQQKRKTLLIDADLRRPGIHQRFGLENDRGLSTVIKDESGWREALQKSEGYPDLDILTAGPASRSAADRLGGTLEKLFAEANPEYDLIVVDSPPLLGFAEPLQMAAIVDGVVVMTLAGQTNRSAVSSVISSLKRVKANVVGVALNEVRKDMSDRYYYYGYYGKYYSKYYKPTKG
jgi:capsular exopolysaccharide synthesis family protein